jgi:hypothetical protein
MATASTGYKLFEDFQAEILQYVHGAPTIMIRTHVRNAIIEFLERSMILKKEPSSFYLTEDEHTYKLKFVNDRYRAVAIKGDIFLGEDESTSHIIGETTEHRLDTTIGRWRKVEAVKPNFGFLTEETNKVRFYPIPNEDSDDEIYMTCAVTLKRDQTEVDEWIYEKYEDIIQAGAVASLLEIPGSSWANEKLAGKFRTVWSRGIKRARAIALKGTGEEAGMVVPQNFEVMGSDNTSRRRYV